MERRVCSKCKVEKELSNDNFQYDKTLSIKRNKPMYSSNCKPCRNEVRRNNKHLFRRNDRYGGVENQPHSYRYKHKKQIEEITDYYVVKCSRYTIDINDKELIETKRALIKLNRVLKNGQRKEV